MVEPCSIIRQYITKQLEYVTKDHIATHTILFMLKTALFFSFLVVWNNIILLITWSRLSVAQASSSFNRLDTCTLTHATPTFITETLCLVIRVQLF